MAELITPDDAVSCGSLGLEELDEDAALARIGF
jgi:hypothetical protein